MKRILIISVWCILGAGLIVLLGFVGKAHDEVKCENLDIRIKYKSDDYFITTDDILNFFATKGIKIKGQCIGDINPYYIESALKSNPYIENAEAYIAMNGDVNISITQKLPLVRVINKFDQSFYINDNGSLMPLNTQYAARVAVANGNIDEFYNPSVLLSNLDSAGADSVRVQKPLFKIYKLVSYISADEFWKAQIEQIYIDPKGDIELFCKVGDFKIIFGDIDNMEYKFQNLFYFFKQGLSKVGWNKYSTINVKFNNQIICSK